MLYTKHITGYNPFKYFVFIAGTLALTAISSCGVELQLISGSVKHATCARPQSGEINQTLNFSNPALTVTHVWNNGATTEDLSGLAPIYPNTFDDKVTINGLPYGPSVSVERYNVFYEADWQRLQHMDFNPTSTIISPQAGFTGRATSANILPEDAIGYMEFIVYQSINPLLDIGIMGFNPVQDYNATSLSNFNGFIFISSGAQHYYAVIRTGHRVTSWGPVYNNGNLFSIKYSNNKLEYFVNGTRVFLSLGTSVPLHLMLHPELYLESRLYGGGLAFKDVHTSFNCSALPDYYASLSKELDGSCYSMVNDVMFKSKEKYNDNLLDYVIYNWQRSPVLSSTGSVPLGSAIVNTSTDNVTGINYHKISVGALLPPEDIYTLETTDSKGELYKMRFRYNRYSKVQNIPIVSHPPVDPVQIKGRTGDVVIFGNDYK